MKRDPVTFGDFTVKFAESEVYSGDVIASQGLEKSVELTISKRLGKVKAAMNESKAIMEEFQMQAMVIWLEHGICGSEPSCLPS